MRQPKPAFLTLINRSMLAAAPLKIKSLLSKVLRRSRLRSITLLTALITRQERYVIATAITIRTRNPTNIIVKDENF